MSEHNLSAMRDDEHAQDIPRRRLYLHLEVLALLLELGNELGSVLLDCVVIEVCCYLEHYKSKHNLRLVMKKSLWSVASALAAHAGIRRTVTVD